MLAMIVCPLLHLISRAALPPPVDLDLDSAASPIPLRVAHESKWTPPSLRRTRGSCNGEKAVPVSSCSATAQRSLARGRDAGELYFDAARGELSRYRPLLARGHVEQAAAALEEGNKFLVAAASRHYAPALVALGEMLYPPAFPHRDHTLRTKAEEHVDYPPATRLRMAIGYFREAAAQGDAWGLLFYALLTDGWSLQKNEMGRLATPSIVQNEGRAAFYYYMAHNEGLAVGTYKFAEALRKNYISRTMVALVLDEIEHVELESAPPALVNRAIARAWSDFHLVAAYERGYPMSAYIIGALGYRGLDATTKTALLFNSTALDDAEQWTKVTPLQHFKWAADRGHAGSMYHVAAWYDHGGGDLIFQWGHQYGGILDQFERPARTEVEGRQDKVQAVLWYTRAARRGHAQSAYALGLHLEAGEGVPQDERSAFAWHKRAAKKNHAGALWRQGLMLMHGRGVDAPDRMGAVRCFERAAELGDVQAAFEAALLLERGAADEVRWQGGGGLLFSDGDDDDDDDDDDDFISPALRAAKLLQKAARAGHHAAERKLALLYRGSDDGAESTSTIGVVARNATRAALLFERAARGGDGIGEFFFALALHQGDGVGVDRDKARRFYARSALKNITSARHNLALLTKQLEMESESKLEPAAAPLDSLVNAGNNDSVDTNGSSGARSTTLAFKERVEFRDPIQRGDEVHSLELGWNSRDQHSREKLFSSEHVLGAPPLLDEKTTVGGSTAPKTMLFEVRNALAMKGEEAASYQFKLALKFDVYANRSHKRYANKLYRSAAEHGSAGAAFNLALNYLAGDGLSQDAEIAVMWLTKAAEQKHLKSLFYLGVAYYSGEGLSGSSEALAEKYWKEAAALGCLRSTLQLGMLAERSNDIPSALSHYRIGAKHGLLDARFRLAMIYKRSEHPTRRAAAKGILEEIARRGHPESQYIEGRRALSENRTADSMRLLRGSALQGFAESAFLLGKTILATSSGEAVEAHEEGEFEGGRSEVASAVRWLSSAAKKGHARAAWELGRLYEKDDVQLASAWYRRACDDALPSACFNLALLLEHGTPPNLVNARHYYTFAVQLSGGAHAKACNALARFFDLGTHGVATNKSHAVALYRKAAEAGVVDAMVNLALTLVEAPTISSCSIESDQSGTCVPRDAKEAQRWLVAAADLGDRAAAVHLARVAGEEAEECERMRERGTVLEREGVGMPQRTGALLLPKHTLASVLLAIICASRIYCERRRRKRLASSLACF